MKNVLLVAVATLLNSSVFAQDLSVPSGWNILKFSVSIGVDQDMIQGLDYHYMLQTAHSADLDRFQNLQISDSDYYAGVCENPQFRAMVTLEVPGLRNTELNLGVQGVFNRYDGVYYNDYQWDDPVENSYEYLSITSLTSELGLEGSITKRIPVFGFLNLYGGAGTNLGYSFDGRMDISGHQNYNTVEKELNRTYGDIAQGTTYETIVFNDVFEQQLRVKDAFHQRVFAQLGLGVVLFDRLELGLDYRRGIGYKAVFDSPVKMTQLHSMSLGAKWILW